MTEAMGYRRKMMLLALLFIAIFIASFFIGRFPVSISGVLRIFADKAIRILTFGRLGLERTWTGQEYSVVMNVRFPRIASAALIGASLSIAGVAFQGMFRNPMVSPDLLGASTGAGFGAALALLLGGSYFAITLSSFAFGLLAVFLAFSISKASRMKSTLAMVLSGVMVSSLFSSSTSFVKLVADPQSQLPAITYWLMGSLSSIKNADLMFALLPIAIGTAVLMALRWRINLLTVSEAEARSMGIETGRLRLAVIIASTLVTAASVSISGMIGWVGLVIPHFARIIFGQDYRKLIPSSALLGASFLIAVDDLARIMTAAEIPLGILTSFIGAPVFIFLIIKGGTEREA